MFCDQDDVWEEDKIEKTLTKMKELEDKYLELPLLVHTDLKVTGESLNILGKSMWSYEHINPNINSLNRLLIQNTVTGCTMMINRRLAQMCLPIPDSCVMHDWWIGLVASEFGKIGCLDEATMSYRQHSSNSIGAKGFSYIDILKKGFSIFLNRNLYIKYLAMNIAQARVFLDMYRNKLDVNTIEMLESFVSIETKSFWKKRKILFKYKLLKQGFMRNIGLFSKI